MNEHACNIDAPYALSVVVNLHREAELCCATLKSAHHAAHIAELEGFRIEILAVLDNSDNATREVVVRNLGSRGRIINTNVDDLGLARNEGVAAARGRMISFLDGDDLFHSFWLRDLLISNETCQDKVIWHPQFNLYFGARLEVFEHLSQDHPDFSIHKLALDNYWSALAAAPRDLFQTCPYLKSEKEHGLGLEDWTWNMNAMAAGYQHRTIPGTWHAIRVKETSSSLLKQSRSLCLMPHLSTRTRFMMLEGMSSQSENRFEPNE